MADSREHLKELLNAVRWFLNTNGKWGIANLEKKLKKYEAAVKAEEEE